MTDLNSAADVTLTNPQNLDQLFFVEGQWINLPSNRIKESIGIFSGTSFLPSTIAPTLAHGTEVYSKTFSLNRSTSDISINVFLQMATNEKNQSGIGFAVFRDSVLIGGAVYSSRDNGNLTKSVVLSTSITDSPNDTNPHTYSIRCGSFTGQNSNYWICSSSLDTDWGSVLSSSSSISIEEIYK